MNFSRKHSRLLSLFVVAFLCLNASGVLCLTYCSQIVEAKADHCPLKKQATPHCPSSIKTEAQTESYSVEASSVTCCMMPVGIFAAPVEKKADTSAVANLETAVNKIAITPVLLVRSTQLSKFLYRPPPNDARLERVRNQVFRI